MAARAFALSTDGTKQRLSDVYGDGVGVVAAKSDIPYRQIVLQAQTAVIAIGDSTITAAGTPYGFQLNAAGTLPLTLGPFSTGPMKLSDLFAVGGGGAILHILAIPY